MKKLKSDWDIDTSEIINKKDCFHFIQRIKNIDIKNIKILNISTLNDIRKLNNNIPHLIELNLSKIQNLELPCSILSNLESLSLRDISKLKFVTKEYKISLNKLKHLYIDNISFNRKNKLIINIDNLKYLDLRLKKDNNSGFYIENVIQDLLQIFNFKFLSVFEIDPNQYENKIFGVYEDFAQIFKNPQKIFEEKHLKNLDYFYFEILYKIYIGRIEVEYDNQFIYKYLFSKTKSNKYLFKTIFINDEYYNGDFLKCIEKEVRYCEKINDKDYYFIDKDMNINGNDLLNTKLDYDNLNRINIILKIDDEDYSQQIMQIFDNFKKNNNSLEIISLDILDINETNFVENLTKFCGLKCFYVKNDYLFDNNNQFITLLTKLSQLKFLCIIDLAIKKELKLNKSEMKNMTILFPDISITINKNQSLIKWNSHNVKF